MDDESVLSRILLGTVVAIYVYTLVDDLVDRELTRTLSTAYYHFRGWIQQRWSTEDQYQRSVGYMLFEAINIVESAP